MRTLSWKLNRNLSASEWHEVTKLVTKLVDCLSQIREAQKNVDPPKGILKFLWKAQQHSVYRLNDPAFQWGVQGDGYNQSRLELLPTPHLKLSPQEKMQQTVMVTCLSHHGFVSWDLSLHVYAWLGTLMILKDKVYSPWEITECSLSEAEKKAILVWASQASH